MADSVSPPPEAPEITEARNRAAYEALRVYCAEPESFRRAVDFAFDAGVAAGRTQAADALGLLRGSEAWLIAVGLPEGQENT